MPFKLELYTKQYNNNNNTYNKCGREKCIYILFVPDYGVTYAPNV